MSADPRQRFAALLQQPDDRIDLVDAALCIAQEAEPDRDLGFCTALLDEIAASIAPYLPPERYPLRWLKVINEHLFQKWGFQGNTDNYYDPRNSYLPEVLERRTGIPITLSLVYWAVAQRLNFPMEGVGMPGHFLLRPQGPDLEIYVDAFHQGEILFPQDCEARLRSIYGDTAALRSQDLVPVSHRYFIGRMLLNLKVIYIKTGSLAPALRTVEQLLLLDPQRAQEHRDRGLILYELERWQEAYPALERYVQLQETPGVDGRRAQDLPIIRQLLETIRSALPRESFD